MESVSTETTLFALHTTVQARWANAENVHGQPGAGGQAQHGRKGSAYRGELAAGETWTLLSADGPGMIRRIWITLRDFTPEMLRGLVLRMYWEGAQTPAVEVPLGDFFCLPLGTLVPFANAWFDSPEGRSVNCRLPMPFRAAARITVTNESPVPQPMFWYEINYTVGDTHSADTGYFHAHFRREHPTTLRQDFAILPQVAGRGRFLGCALGVMADAARYGKTWWGEGEVKVYLDDDTDFPTLCGTGTEDYMGSAWGIGRFSLPWYGCTVADEEAMRFGMYRLHGPDPILFQRACRVTIQQIGWEFARVLRGYVEEGRLPEIIATGDGTVRYSAADLAAMPENAGFLFERQDDWCATAYFVLDRPENGLPAIQPYAERIQGL